MFGSVRPLIALPSRLTESADTWRVPATALGRPYQQAIIRAGGVPLAVPPLFAEDDVEDAADDVIGSRRRPVPAGRPRRLAAALRRRRAASPADQRVRRARCTRPRAGPGRRRPRQAGAGDLPRTSSAQRRPRRNPAPAPARRHRQASRRALPAPQRHRCRRRIANRRSDGHARGRGHCVHHQAIDELAPGLVVTAWSGDVIEGVELPDRWVVGVQWHPEDTAAADPVQQALFDAFVAAARQPVVTT